ncbi:unnamed protein product [Brachionus calyciflorus]|uniref:Elongation of very long chain fatty acids protein n=1 Tax=Brachionus calyciflorus TaxID=104777 RepID=A0A814HRZ8_9BILA|nr:unnamed protein product [Brachionus calyciflorus]
MDFLQENLHNLNNYLKGYFKKVDWYDYANKLNQTYQNHPSLINKNVREWPLMKSIDETLAISAGYLASILIFSFLMKFLNEFKLKFLLFCYNLFLIVLNIYISFQILHIKYQAEDFGLCSKVNRSNKGALDKMNRIIWWFYVAKGLELLNTLFFVLRKKFHKLDFLHIYNHSTMFPVWWICTAYFHNGAIANGALMNSLLHIIMHFYFIVSSMGPSFQKFIWWKKYIVQLQMLQFFLLIVYFSYLLKNECPDSLSENMIWYGIYYSLSHVVLIYNFYTKSYYRIMDAYLEKTKKEKENPNGDFDDTQNDFKLGVSRRRPLRS